jgi:hypothetical protein
MAALGQNRPAALQMFGGVGVEFRVAKIDEVEIDAVELRAAEVGAAEVGFGDFRTYSYSGSRAFSSLAAAARWDASIRPRSFGKAVRLSR